MLVSHPELDLHRIVFPISPVPFFAYRTLHRIYDIEFSQQSRVFKCLHHSHLLLVGILHSADVDDRKIPLRQLP